MPSQRVRIESLRLSLIHQNNLVSPDSTKVSLNFNPPRV